MWTDRPAPAPPPPPAASCQEHRDRDSSAASGIYFIAAGDLGVVRVYCDMDNDDGYGWTKVIGVEKSNRNHCTDEAVAFTDRSTVGQAVPGCVRNGVPADPLFDKTACDDTCGGLYFVAQAGICTGCDNVGDDVTAEFAAANGLQFCGAPPNGLGVGDFGKLSDAHINHILGPSGILKAVETEPDERTVYFRKTKAAACAETEVGNSVAADLAACAGVTELADDAACLAVLTDSAEDDAAAKACTYSPGLLTQGVPGVPQDPLAPPCGPLRYSPVRERAIGNAPALVPGLLARL
jgi:hypothetical protein